MTTRKFKINDKFLKLIKDNKKMFEVRLVPDKGQNCKVGDKMEI